MNLYLVVHGTAVPVEKDPEQPLSEAGIAESSRLARMLRALGGSRVSPRPRPRLVAGRAPRSSCPPSCLVDA
ncbi:protein of unknown function [Methylacidimicrobium sp. AP8]|nr:protein of unknown function [Methylacidimicrobium sp. AP8]